MPSDTTWSLSSELNTNTFAALLSGDICGINIPVLSSEEARLCAQVIMTRGGFTTERRKPETWQRIGESYPALSHGEEYFERVVAWENLLASLFPEALNPVESLTAPLKELLGATLAEETGLGRYSPAVFTLGATGFLHCDRSRVTLPHFAIGTTKCQVGVALPLLVEPGNSTSLSPEEEDTSGYVEIFRVTPDNVFDPQDPLCDNLPEELLVGYQRALIAPKVGTLQIINTSFYHRVLPGNKRLVVRNFFGQLNDGSWIYWA